jgi:DNA-binding IclR family transcriptional regulator
VDIGLSESFDADDAFLDLRAPEDEVRAALEKLVALGAVERDGERYRLSAEGLPEARRRFVDDFREMLADGHGECNFSCEADHEHDR